MIIEIINELKRILTNHYRNNNYYRTKGKNNYNSKIKAGKSQDTSDSKENLPPENSQQVVLDDERFFCLN